MRKISNHTVSHAPNYNKHTFNRVTCQRKHQKSLGKVPSRTKSKQWLIACLVIIFVILWMIVALITQNFFLLSSIPLLAHEVAYALHRAVDVLLPHE
jgi:hypothetical protein